MKIFQDRIWAYWHSRGYYDGRIEGEMDDEVLLGKKVLDVYKSAYKEGYDTGVGDYWELDEEKIHGAQSD